jgi:hypothetical protein
MLYFWPPAPINGADIRVSMLEQPLWRMRNSTNIVVRDLTIEMGRADLVDIEGGTRNAFIHCTLRNAGDYAGRVSGTSNGVSSCTITHPGEGGIALSGASSRASLVPVNNFVCNCDIRDFGRWAWTYQPGALINAEAVGCWVSHNSMHDSPHTAILFGRCNDNVIEYNEVGNVCTWSADAGAIYIGRDWGARGNVIRYNFVHDVDSLFVGYGTHGIYLDDCQSGVQVFGNVLYRISDYGIQMGGGRDNLMENNVIVKCGTGLAADGRGAGWMLDNGGSYNLWSDLQNYPYQGALWSNAYPLCAAIPNNWTAITNGTWLRPEGDVFSRNIGFSNATWTGQSDNAYFYFKEITNNIVNADPLFVDEANLNLALRTNSPAYTIPGFQPISFAKIGLESNLMLTVHVRGGGSVVPAPAQPDYYPMQFAYLAAAPSNNYWYFDSWTGGVTGTASGISVWVTNDLDVTAVFKPFVVTNGTPVWWLAQYGRATNDAGALGDDDHDGCPNWQEYIAGTNPTNKDDRLKIVQMYPSSTNTDNIVLVWQAVADRSYAVMMTTNLFSPWTSVVDSAYTNIAGSFPTLCYTNASQSNSASFFRIKAKMPE